jgi:hypothetical protein
VQFAAPIWLLGLIPWAAVAIYLLIGRRQRIVVPFIDLWQRSVSQAQQRRQLSLPPSLAAFLAAMALGIFAAAGPQIRRSETNRPIVLIVDRGITMSARSGSQRRFQALAARAEQTMLNTLGPGAARLIVVPSGEEQTVDRAFFSAQIGALSPTAVDSRAAITDAVRAALLQKQAIVIVLSDQPIGAQSDRLIQIVPDDSPSHIGIERFSYRTDPTPQAMIRIVSDQSSFDCNLAVTGSPPLHIASPGDYFVDLSSAPETISASLSPPADINVDARAFAAREPAWPKLLPDNTLPPELRRVIDAYAKNRTPRADSPVVAISPISATDQTAALTLTDSTPTTSSPNSKIEASTESLVQGIDWQAAARNARFSASSPPPGFTRLVWSGNRTLVAMRTAPTRQLWIGFRSSDWAATPQFVVFWTNAFDWLGQSQTHYTAVTAGAPGAPLWPGIYGHVVVNAAPVPTETVKSADWPARLSMLANSQTVLVFDYSSWLLVAAVGCLLLAAMLR